jgi:hypothetical protein
MRTRRLLKTKNQHRTSLVHEGIRTRIKLALETSDKVTVISKIGRIITLNYMC